MGKTFDNYKKLEKTFARHQRKNRNLSLTKCFICTTLWWDNLLTNDQTEQTKSILFQSFSKQDFDVNNGYEQLAINFGDEFIFAFTMKMLFDNEKVRPLHVFLE